MSRLLMFRNTRKAIQKSCGSRNFGKKGDGTYAIFRPCGPQYRVYSQFRHNHGGYMPSTLYRPQHFTYKSGCPRNFSTMYASNTISHHAHNAWKRISKMRSTHSSATPTISRAAQAFTIASTRSHLLVPGIFTLIFWKAVVNRNSLC
ncbi:Bromodomain adjacent to zinc finger domain protein 2B [Bienertia sinuspersici]